MEENKLTFEEGLTELDRIVAELERGEQSLEESIRSFETAKRLEVRLRGMLDDMDARIRVLTEGGEEPFGEENEDAQSE